MKKINHGTVAFFCLALLYHSKLLQAQENRLPKLDKEAVVFEGNHFGFYFSLFKNSKAAGKPIEGNYPLTASASTGAGLLFDYTVNLNKRESIFTGIKAGIFGRNFHLNFSKNDFSPALKQNYFFSGSSTYVGDLVLSWQAAFQKRYFYRKNRYWSGQAGFCLNYSTGSDFDTDVVLVENASSQIIQVAEINKYANNDAKPWLSYLFSAGHSWILKNNNIANVSVVSNLSFTKYVKGNYHISIPGKPDTQGAYSAKGSYVGIAMSYFFTNANYRIRKRYERQGQ